MTGQQYVKRTVSGVSATSDNLLDRFNRETTPVLAETRERLNSLVDATAGIVPDLASLRSYGGVQKTIQLSGRAAAGDGGAGLFFWDAAATEPDDGGTVIALDAGGTGRFRRLWTGAIDVRWFGAISGDTSKAASNVAAFQSAIGAAAQSGSGVNGGTVFVPSGVWYMSGTISLEKVDSVVLAGAGGSGWANAYGHQTSRLVWIGGYSGPAVVLHGCWYCRLQDLALDGYDGTRLSAQGVSINGRTTDSTPSKNCSVVRCYITNFSGDGITLGNSTTNPDTVNNRFEGFSVVGCGVGVRQSGGQTINNVFDTGFVVANATVGMYFLGGDITARNIQFASDQPTAVADVRVANATSVLDAEFIDNYHETIVGTTYLFDAGTNRVEATTITRCRMLYLGPAGGRCLDYQQTGPITLRGCRFDGFSGYAAEAYVNTPGGGSPGSFIDIGSMYVNGAFVTVASSVGGYGEYGTLGGVDPSAPPAARGDYSAPNTRDFRDGHRLIVHNGTIEWQDNHLGGTLYNWQVRSNDGLLQGAYGGTVRWGWSLDGRLSYFGSGNINLAPQLTANAGPPEGVVLAPPGSTCADVTNGEVYIKKSGTGNTGWKLVTHA